MLVEGWALLGLASPLAAGALIGSLRSRFSAGSAILSIGLDMGKDGRRKAGTSGTAQPGAPGCYLGGTRLRLSVPEWPAAWSGGEDLGGDLWP